MKNLVSTLDIVYQIQTKICIRQNTQHKKIKTIKMIEKKQMKLMNKQQERELNDNENVY